MRKKNVVNYPAIVVEIPHCFPAIAYTVYSERELIDIVEAPCQTADEAIEKLGNDLHQIWFDSREEIARRAQNYDGHQWPKVQTAVEREIQ